MHTPLIQNMKLELRHVIICSLVSQNQCYSSQNLCDWSTNLTSRFLLSGSILGYRYVAKQHPGSRFKTKSQKFITLNLGPSIRDADSRIASRSSHISRFRTSLSACQLSCSGDFILCFALNLSFWWSIVHPSTWFPSLSREVIRISLPSSNFLSRTSAWFCTSWQSIVA